MTEVLVVRVGRVLEVTLNRPDAYNALTRRMQRALREALEEAASDEIRAVLLTGAGKAFCAGQDLRELAELPGSVGEALEETYHPNVRAIRALEKPVIAALNGPAAGAGLSLACACDLRIASDAATLVPGFAGIGLVPDAGGTWFLSRLLGPARAFEWMSSNRRLAAEEAYALGLVSEVVPAASFRERAAEFAGEWAAGPTRAIGLAKRLFQNAASATLDEQLALEAELQDLAARSGDFGEGVAAFLEKRAPSFTGS